MSHFPDSLKYSGRFGLPTFNKRNASNILIQLHSFRSLIPDFCMHKISSIKLSWILFFLYLQHTILRNIVSWHNLSQL